MKKSNVINFLMLVVFVAFISACSKSSDTAPDCEHCHIALPNPVFGTDSCNGCPDEWAWEIESPSNGHNFCGDELATAEAVGYNHTITEMLINDDGDTLMPGTYGPGSANPTYEIHCGHDED